MKRLDKAAARQIVEGVVAVMPADMPVHRDEERLDVARQRMIVASSGMRDNTDLILEAVAARRASGAVVTPVCRELGRWQIGDLTFSDADLWRLAASRGLVGGADA